jgi:hypothetical protein
MLHHLNNIDLDFLSALSSWIRFYGAPVLKDCFDLGGVLRLLVYLKHNEDDRRSAKILIDCLRVRENNEHHGSCDNSNFEQDRRNDCGTKRNRILSSSHR